MNENDQKALARLGAISSVQSDEVVLPQQKYPRLRKIIREVFVPALITAGLLTSMVADAHHRRSHDADAAIPPLSIPSPHVEVSPPEEKVGPSIITKIIQDGDTWFGLAKLFSVPPGEWEDWKNQMIAYNNKLSEEEDNSGNQIDFTNLEPGQEVELFSTGPFKMIIPS